VAVYGDREHSAHLLFLTNFDPRFEEALLLLGPRDERVLVVGNEGMIHAREARLPVEVALYQPFSLMGQPRGDSPPLVELLRGVGLERNATVGVVGWKYLDGREAADPTRPAYVPDFLVTALAEATGAAPVDVTALLMDSTEGLRSRVSASEIARLEWGAARASAAVLRVVRAARPGRTELETLGEMGYQGEPQSCHPILASSDAALNGLRSPTARRAAEGDAITCGIGYWGGLCCRAGLLSGEVDEEFLATTVRPYFAAIVVWWTTMGIGVTGGEVYRAVIDALGDATFRPMLNPGHLTSYDEWVHSPIYAGSTETVASGMVFQCDIIPTPLPPGRALNCEDTAAVADEALRDAIAREQPELWERIEARRAFMRDELGIRLRPEILPLSVAPAYLPPFWLQPTLVCTVGE
jgi:Xaa-Pro aminopeptidase